MFFSAYFVMNCFRLICCNNCNDSAIKLVKLKLHACYVLLTLFEATVLKPLIICIMMLLQHRIYKKIHFSSCLVSQLLGFCIDCATPNIPELLLRILICCTFFKKLVSYHRRQRTKVPIFWCSTFPIRPKMCL